MKRTAPLAHAFKTSDDAVSTLSDDAACVMCGDQIGSQPWAQLACGAEHVAHNVCLFERALASECCAVRCGRAGCGRVTPVACASTTFSGVRRLDAPRHVVVSAGKSQITPASHTGGGPDEAQRGRAAALEASVPALSVLPFELLVRILALLDSADDLAAANATARLFRGTPGGRSPVEHALRERARARGHERVAPTRPPTLTTMLLERERVLACARAHMVIIACGLNFSAFVDAEGGLHTCGETVEEVEEEEDPNEAGEEVAVWFAPAASGHGKEDDGAPSVLVPRPVASLSAVHVAAVAAGAGHLLALSGSGAVYACGYNEYGQLGLGDDFARWAFTRVEALAREQVVCIAAGIAHNLALTAAGCVYSWGYNHRGRLGHGDAKERWVPTRIEALHGVPVGGVAAGFDHTLLLSAHGAVYSCGNGDFGRLGHGDQQEKHTPSRIEALVGVCAVRVSAGEEHSLVVDAAGRVHSFGSGPKLGHGGSGDEHMPRRIEALAGVHATRACASFSGSAVVGADGSVHAWGDGRPCNVQWFGLDFGAEHDFTLPARMTALAGERVMDCALHDDHALFVTADGAVYSSGMQGGKLGLGRSAADEAGAGNVQAPTRIAQLPPLQRGH